MHIRLDNDHDLAETLAGYIARTSSFRNGNCTYSFETPSAAGIIKEIYLAPDAAVTLIDVRTVERFTFQTSMAVPHMVEAGFALEGNVEFSMKGSRHDFNTYAGQGYLSVAGGEMESILSVQPGQHVRIAEIRFSTESFDSYSAYADWVLPAPLKPAVWSERETTLKCACLLSAEMRTGVDALLKNGFAGSLSAMEMEALCIDCTSCLVAFFRDGMGRTRTLISSAELEKIREARDILRRRMENPPGIRELACMVNLNDYKLKTGFRQAFGSTVHRTLTGMRLQRAFELISEKGFTVTNAAIRVGFNNIGDFCMAFKRRYGVTPGKLRSRNAFMSSPGEAS
ncbi:AraC family transcriptional regulator [Marispirochaeta sp.]|uniref:helix-turn-helix transcriptional regulator n=1 Tax=Marispirochaeta sp. TaxID=2038653 RepID=UPI0029C850A2|nr:AraC family transcriptional regulator [Marispirochaeta sp.]